ncbi:hypothetical protein F5Y18DRAFT_369552 [Xylariaceae sp. FL1019]|nr:hypothetical protein F5Y18DRAFT_369552 [Xylariaceae sp. FL1019]
MGTLRSRAFLRCFYCGKKSNTRFDGQKSFDCAQCEATNWLDPNGDITDPPVDHQSRDASAVQYAIPRSNTFRSPSPPPASALQNQPEHPIFCSTCIRNQHMINSSLAQFEWPDDPTTAEYAARERKFWALRKDLETRYPQVCQDCAPKVNQKLNQASYAAQTDHLRRMMDRTRAQRKETKRWSPLDTVDTLGRWCWYIGFILQAVWHITMVCFLLTEQYATEREDSWLATAWSMLRQAVASALPYTDRLMQWAINLGLCAFPWNPRFKQSIRGFTAHILGFRQWYTYQLFIVLMRLICLSIAQYSKSQGLPIGAQLGAQLFIPLLMVYVYDAARRSIRTDTSPLFRRPVPVTANSPTAPRKSPGGKSSNDLGNVLDEILQSADTKESRNQPDPAQQVSANAFQAAPRPYKKSNGHTSTIRTSTQSQPNFGDLRLSNSLAPTNHEPTVAHYDEEMDWSPSASQHRAFSSYNSYKIKNTNPRFSDTPTEPKAGPIWYKVPPAPTNPAQVVRNPPMRPIIRESPKDTKPNFFQSTRRPVDLGGKHQSTTSEFTLSQPKFYAPQPKDDPRDGLSSMFASSFSLSPSPEDAEARTAQAKHAASSGNYELGISPDRTTTRVVELFALVLALGGWIFALGSTEHYARSIAMASICGCLIVSIRLAADLEVDRRVRGQGQSRTSVLQPSLASLALVQTAIILLLMWRVWSGGALQVSGTFGNALFGSLIVHHTWHIFA